MCFVVAFFSSGENVRKRREKEKSVRFSFDLQYDCEIKRALNRDQVPLFLHVLAPAKKKKH